MFGAWFDNVYTYCLIFLRGNCFLKSEKSGDFWFLYKGAY